MNNRISLHLSTSFALVILAMAQAVHCADLKLSGATYLGGPQADEASAVDIAPDKSIVFAGKIHGGKFGKTPTELLGGGSGAVIRFDATGAEVLSATRIGDSVDDMEVNKSNGQIAIIGDFGAALLWPDAAGVFWHKKLSPAGGFVLVVSPDFSKRLLWTTFETDSYASTPKAIAAAAGAAVIASDAQKDAMVTLAAIQKEANNPSKDSPDAYLAVWNTDGQR